MRYFLFTFIGLALIACTHGAQVSQNDADKGQAYYGFQPFQTQRGVSATPEKKKQSKKSLEAQQFVTVYPCKKGEVCQPKDEEKKVVPFNDFAEKVKINSQKNKDVLDRQEKILANGVAQLKEQRKVMEQEYAYFDHQERVYRYDSLRPVIDNYRRAKAEIAKDLENFDSKIQQFEKDLNYLKNSGKQRVGMDVPTNKLMDMVEDGQWATFGAYLSKDEQVLWQFFQQVGQDIAKN